MNLKNELNNPNDLKACEENSESLERRDFTKKALAIGVLSSLSLFTAPQAAMAWMDGKFNEREDLGDAFKALVKTYSDVTPYPHKFNDALVKMQLRDFDFVFQKGMDKEFAAHFVSTLGVLINQYITKAIPKFGKDIFLWGIFERTSCSYQLYERIDISKNQRTVPCPYKPILAQLDEELGTYQIEWKDVCEKWCIPVWEGFASVAGVKVKVQTGETCSVKVV